MFSSVFISCADTIKASVDDPSYLSRIWDPGSKNNPNRRGKNKSDVIPVPFYITINLTKFVFVFGVADPAPDVFGPPGSGSGSGSGSFYHQAK
jgi:hypothetical protein